MAMNMDAVLNLRANVQGTNNIVELNRGLMAVEGTAKGVSGAMRGLTGAAAGLSGALGALAPLATVAGLVGLAKGALDAGDKMHDLAQSTGVSVEALGRFKKAAAVSGTDIDAVGKSLVKLSKSMLEASVGGKQQAAAFKALGISVTDSRGQLKSADAVMLEIADRFKQMPDGVAKTALALKFFGRAGAEMIPMLDMGGAAIDKLSTKMTTAFAEKADAYKDKLAILGGKVGALGADLLITLLPALDKITDAVTGAIDAFNKLPEPVKNFAVSGAAVAIAWGPTTSLIRGAIGVFALFSTSATAAGAAAAGATPRIAALKTALGGLLRFGLVTLAIDVVVNGMSKLVELQARLGKITGRSTGDYFKDIGGQSASREKLTSELAKVRAQEKAFAQEAKSVRFPWLTGQDEAARAGLLVAQTREAKLLSQIPRARLASQIPSGSAGFSPDLDALRAGSGGGGGGSKAAKERESRLSEILAANGLYRAQETIKARIAKAEFDQNTPEKLRLEYIDRGVALLAEAAAIQRDKIPQDEKEAKLQGIKDKFIASQNQYQRELVTFQRQAIDSLPSYLSGLESAAATYGKTVENSKQLTAEQEKQKQLADGIAQTVGGGMASAFDALISGTEGFGNSLRKIAAGVLKDIAKQLLQIYVINTAINAISGLFGPKTGGFASGVKFNPSAFSMPSLLSANGNVFAANGIVPYAMGGIVDRPTLFPFAKGIGLMGEAGPEAIMPLKRGADGKLGVAGGGGNTTINVSVDAKGSNVQGDAGKGNQLAQVVAAAVQAEMIKQKRPGGVLYG